MEFPASEGGESHTLGELKDMLATESDHTGRDLELNERRIAFDSEQVKAKEELAIILRALPPEALTPEVLERVRAERDTHMAQEKQLLLQTIPEWNDVGVKQAELKDISAHMQDYGFQDGQIDLLSDHRMIRYMRDNMQRKQMVERALGKVTAGKKAVPKTKANKPRATAPANQAVKTGSSLGEQVSAISSLLT